MVRLKCVMADKVFTLAIKGLTYIEYGADRSIDEFILITSLHWSRYLQK